MTYNEIFETCEFRSRLLCVKLKELKACDPKICPLTDKKNKYNIAPKEERTIHGRTFASKAEMNRYLELSMLERAGEIRDLLCQVRFDLLLPYQHPVHGRFRGIVYYADFTYREKGNPLLVVEDIKGVKTPTYKIKKTILLWKYSKIDFREVKVKS